MTLMRISNKKRTACVTKGRGGMVVTATREASEAGIEILKKGGNAFDAAVAVSLVLAVTEPECSGLGGNGFMTAHLGKENRNVFLDFWTMAPGWATPENLKKKEENDPAFYMVGIPGEAAGLDYICRTYGTMPLRELVKPAVKLAREGFPVGRLLANDLNVFHEKLACYAEGNNPYVTKEHWKAGDILRNPDLADSIEAFGEGGADAFYRGPLTDKMIAGLNRFGGQFTREDFARYTVHPGIPSYGRYRDYEIFSSQPPSTGGTAVIESLQMLEHFPVSDWAFDSPERLFVLSEIFKKSFSDRYKYICDPMPQEMPLKGLRSPEFAALRASQIRIGRAEAPAPDDPWPYESPDTTHFSIADAEGNLVAETQTISAFFGCGIVPAGTGIVFNSQINGLPVGKAAPYCRSISTTSPTLLFKDGKPFAVVGSPGANRIISTVAQVIHNMIDGKMTAEEAVFAPRIFNDQNGTFRYEGDFSPETIRKIEEWGQPVEGMMPLARYMGGVGLIRFEDDGTMTGVADSRRDGVALCTEPATAAAGPKEEDGPVIFYRSHRSLAKSGNRCRGSAKAWRRYWHSGSTIY